jgi:hypothetical protein
MNPLYFLLLTFYFFPSRLLIVEVIHIERNVVIAEAIKQIIV